MGAPDRRNGANVQTDASFCPCVSYVEFWDILGRYAVCIGMKALSIV